MDGFVLLITSHSSLGIKRVHKHVLSDGVWRFVSCRHQSQTHVPDIFPGDLRGAIDRGPGFRMDVQAFGDRLVLFLSPARRFPGDR